MTKIKYLLCCLLIIASASNDIMAQKRRGRTRKNDKESSQEIDIKVTDTFIDAVSFYNRGENHKAIEKVNKCLDINKKHAPSYFLLSKVYLNLSDVVSAEANIKKAIELSPENKWYKIYLLEFYRNNQDKDGFLEAAKNLVKEFPDDVAYKYDLAAAYVINGDFKRAVSLYDQIEDAIGVNEVLSKQKYSIYLLSNQIDKAINELEKLIEAQPESAVRNYSIIAEMLMSKKQPDEAAKYYLKITEIAPDDPYIHISLADYYRSKGEIDKFFSELEKGFANKNLKYETKIDVLFSFVNDQNVINNREADILKLAETLVSTHPNEFHANVMYADFLFMEKEYQKAQIHYKKTISIDSGKYMVWENLMRVDLLLSDMDALQNHSKRAIALFPMQTMPYLMGGIASIDKKDYEQAINYLEKGLNFIIDDEHLEAHCCQMLAEAYHNVSNYELSDQYFEKALKINPDDSHTLNNYAYYLSLRNTRLDKALEMSRKSLEIDAENSANLDTYGWILYMQGKYSEALEWISKAVDISKKTSPVILEHLGDVYYKLNDKENALKYWKEALELESNNEELNNKINGIDK